MPEKIPVTTLAEMEKLYEEGIANQDDWEEFIDAFYGVRAGWRGYIYPNIKQKGSPPAASDQFANDCHDPQTGRFCEVPGHPKAEADQAPHAVVEGQMPRKEVGVAVRRTFALIDQVHNVPDGLAKLPIRTNRSLKSQAVYEYYDAPDGEKPKQISVNPDRSQHLELSFTHEFGHYLDSQVFDRRSGATKEMLALRDAIYDTEAMKTLQVIAESSVNSKAVTRRASYYFSKTEAFARAYAQYIAMKTQDPELVSQVNGILTYDRTLNNVYPYSQWGVKDFEPVYHAFDKLFASKKLLKSKKGYFKK